MTLGNLFNPPVADTLQRSFLVKYISLPDSVILYLTEVCESYIAMAPK